LPQASRKGPYRPRNPKASPNPRYRPRDPKRAKYYKASLVAASVFLVLAVLFPFWLDHVKRSRDRADIEASAAVSFVPPKTQVAAPVKRIRSPVATVPYSNMPNAGCQAYVNARCNALGIRPGICGEIEGVAARVPSSEGMPGCRKAVEARLKEAASYSMVDEKEDTEAEFAGAGDGTATAPLVVAAGGKGTQEEKDSEEKDSEEQGKQDVDKKKVKEGSGKSDLTPAEKADNLERIHILVEELQRASLNYSTLPAAQRVRFMELQKRVEKDGSPELRKLYNVLLRQHGRTAWYDVGKAGLNATESKRIETGSRTEPAPTTTPQMDEVRKMMNQARREAGRPTGPPPSLGPSSPPTSIEPSSVEAPPARSL